MNIYDFEIIKAQADCRDIAINLLGMKPKSSASGEWVSFDSPWRPGSDSGAFSVGVKGYKDHVSGESGSVLDLVANAKFGGEIFLAQELIGQHLHLKPSMEAKKKREFVCAYDYVDAGGVLLHQTIRWKPKDFTQRRPDPAKKGEWIWSISGIEPVLYRLPQLIESPWVCVVGGEKDADNLAGIGIPATTNPMGEGNWRDSYNQFFAGKSVVILPDLDDVGRKHAQTVAFALKDIAKSIRIIELPFPEDASPAKDPSDWISSMRLSGNQDADIAANLKAVIKATPLATVVETPTATQKQISDAKKANREPFKNFDMMNGIDAKGKEKQMKEPRHVSAMIDDIKKRFWGFPRRVGSTLFDHDRKTGKIRTLDSPPLLMGWISEKSGHNVSWTKNEGAMTEPEFFGCLHANAQYYEMISCVPNWPKRDDVYYTYGDLPAPDPKAAAFHEFCNFFSPATEADWHLLRAFMASPLYFRPKVDRPLWVIDATAGQGCFAPGTGIRMFNGLVKKVENVKVGDILMGPDSTPRTVKKLYNGLEEMFKFTYSNKDYHIVNRSHDLYLVPLRSNKRYGNISGGRDGIIVPVSEYITWNKNKKLNFGVIKKPITSFKDKNLVIPPYILGCWLGDGSRNATSITNIDPEINNEWNKYGESMGLNSREYGLERATTTHLLVNRGQKNPMRDMLTELGVWKNKHIPFEYMTGSMDQRLELLAGIIDTDGTNDKGSRMLSITQKNKRLSYQILDLCRSVGVSANISKIKKYCTYKGERREGEYYCIYIGRNAEIIPVRVQRKKIDLSIPKQKNNLHYAIKSVESMGVGEYFGFELDGDHLFLGEDYTVLKNTGKTKMVEMMTLLYGGDDPDCGEPAWIDAGQLNNETTLDKSVKRLLSSSGRKKRVALLDNVTGFFRSPALATLVTQGSISGMAPYGHGEETRPNDLTWVITSNSATLDRDLTDRSQIIKLCPPKDPAARWTQNIMDFLKEKRLQVISDIIGLLEAGPQFEFTAMSRFREWEREICAPIMGTKEVWEATMNVTKERQKAADGDIENALIIRDCIRDKLAEHGLDWERELIWLQSQVVATWIMEALPNSGWRTNSGCLSHFRNMVKIGQLPELSDKIEIFPHQGKNRRRGFMVGYDKYYSGAMVKIVGMGTDKNIKIIDSVRIG